jgi:NOL1/NOP2/fmu family ribosome biogenesis protein
MGQDIDVDGSYEGFVILKHGNDYVGSGKFKEGIILNFVPKARRLLEVH